MDPAVTTEEFVRRLYRGYDAVIPEGVLLTASEAGILEPLDRVLAGEGIERRSAARIIHRFLQKVLEEPDEPAWESAKKLKDLYDCRSCVDHVGQVYCKGIMDEKQTEDGQFIFGMREHITKAEAEEIVERIFNSGKRCVK